MADGLTLEQRRQRQASRVRIADLRVAIGRAISTVLDQYPGELTCEEVCAALNDVMGRHLGHLLNGEQATRG